ncbi:CrcB family protein [Microbacterium limosum]|uniref:Fluoride-specific ion channel FluC n=1 Tax=Microbacterium limosum TaxID=3079935 RepID=A0AAU0MH22_9MICO|nr:CrcB family protein [Microbacterium sp. Y20]WOQ69801.1 CrcB family protein [Microbacterium sp. Y20]
MSPIRWSLLPLVILGGTLGVAAREGLLLLVPADAAPIMTLAINLVGSALLGVVVGALDDRHPRWRAALGTGAMGGFTTYSAFAVQAVASATPVLGVALVIATLAGGAVAGFLGLVAGRALADRPGEVEDPAGAE